MTHLTVEGLAEFLGRYPLSKVLDVRFTYEREAGHLPGDHHVPWLTPGRMSDPYFVDQVLQRCSPEDYVLVISRAGHRSGGAAARLEKSGFAHVYNLLGGYEDFRSARPMGTAAVAACSSTQGGPENDQN
jgi:rhodanese-related sulfurtransferase